MFDYLIVFRRISWLDGDAIGASHFLPPMLGNALEAPYIPVTVNRIISLSAT